MKIVGKVFITGITLTLLIVLRTTLGYSSDVPNYKELCGEDTINVEEGTAILDVVSNYKVLGKALQNGEYLLCLNGSEFAIRGSILLPRYDEKIVIVGAKFDLRNINSNITVSGNAIFVDIKVGPSLTPLTITGSNVSIISSRITAAQTGIAIQGAEDAPIRDIAIRDTRITKVGASENTKGVYVDNANGVQIKTGTKAIEFFNYGVYVKSGEGINVADTNFTIPNPANAIFWAIPPPLEGNRVVDTTMVGKRLDDTEGHATRLAGLAPMCTGSVDVFKLEEQVVQGVGNNPSTSISFMYSCPITTLIVNDRLCLKATDATDEYKTAEKCEAEGDCKCFGAGECIYSCDNVSEPINNHVLFSYINENNSNSFSEFIAIYDLKDIMSSIPLMLPEGPVASGLQDGHETSDIFDEPASIPDDGRATTGGSGAGTTIGGEAAPTSGGFGAMKSCSLSKIEISGKLSAPKIIFSILVISMPLFIRLLFRRRGRGY